MLIRALYHLDVEGESISPELKKQIFIPFAKGYNGANGLGLSITKMILLQHQGDLSDFGKL